MERRHALKLTGMALLGALGLPSIAEAAEKEKHAMPVERKDIERIAAA